MEIRLRKEFRAAIKNDMRIGPVHISLYEAIIDCWEEQGFSDPIHVYAKKLMPLAKISSAATYHKVIRELHDYKYIRYEPSCDARYGSLVYLKVADAGLGL